MEKVATNQLNAGLLSGIIAGVVFGAMMGMMGMLPMVAKLVGGDSALVGFITHLAFSAIIGFIFALVIGKTSLERGKIIGLGLLYGFVWWILGPLIIMPVWLGMGVQLSLAGASMALPSLWGHLVYGFILGLIFPLIAARKDVAAAR